MTRVKEIGIAVLETDSRGLIVAFTFPLISIKEFAALAVNSFRKFVASSKLNKDINIGPVAYAHVLAESEVAKVILADASLQNKIGFGFGCNFVTSFKILPATRILMTP